MGSSSAGKGKDAPDHSKTQEAREIRDFPDPDLTVGCEILLKQANGLMLQGYFGRSHTYLVACFRTMGPLHPEKRQAELARLQNLVRMGVQEEAMQCFKDLQGTFTLTNAEIFFSLVRFGRFKEAFNSRYWRQLQGIVEHGLPQPGDDWDSKEVFFLPAIIATLLIFNTVELCTRNGINNHGLHQILSACEEIILASLPQAEAAHPQPHYNATIPEAFHTHLFVHHLGLGWIQIGRGLLLAAELLWDAAQDCLEQAIAQAAKIQDIGMESWAYLVRGMITIEHATGLNQQFKAQGDSLIEQGLDFLQRASSLFVAMPEYTGFALAQLYTGEGRFQLSQYKAAVVAFDRAALQAKGPPVGLTPLAIGTLRDDVKILRHASSVGADLSIYDLQGCCLLDIAAQGSREASREFLFDTDAGKLLAQEFLLKKALTSCGRMFFEAEKEMLDEFQAAFDEGVPAFHLRQIYQRQVLQQYGEVFAPVYVVQLRAFNEAGKLSRPADELQTVNIADLPVDAFVAFISHRWLQPSLEDGHPDDKNKTKFNLICRLMQQLAADNRLLVDKIYLWIDYSSLQQAPAALNRTINSLPLAIQLCDVFVSLEHEEYWHRSWCLAEVMFALKAFDKRGYPQLYQSKGALLSPIPKPHKCADYDMVHPWAVRSGKLTRESDRRKMILFTVQATLF